MGAPRRMDAPALDDTGRGELMATFNVLNRGAMSIEFVARRNTIDVNVGVDAYISIKSLAEAHAAHDQFAEAVAKWEAWAAKTSEPVETSGR